MLTFLTLFSTALLSTVSEPAPQSSTSSVPTLVSASESTYSTPEIILAGANVSTRGAQEVVHAQDVRSLPGQLDEIPVFNSNSPEVIQKNGILLSTFPPDDMAVPDAHLNYAFDGRFDIFAHHIARGVTHDDVRTMYMGIVLYNSNSSPVTINTSQAVSYLSQDAPFLNLPAYVANPLGNVFSGPGSRVMGDVLRGYRQSHWPEMVTIAPGRAHLLVNVPIPLRRLSVPTNGTLSPGRLILPPLPQPEPEEEEETMASASLTSGLMPGVTPRPQALPINGRTMLMRLFSSGPVHVASLAMYAPTTSENNERVPNLRDWLRVLSREGLSGPRDYPPTPPNAERFSRFFYGRVAGVAEGSQWTATLTDGPGREELTLPETGQRVSYVLSTLDYNTFGTGQIQSAEIISRYPDTAYRAHGNYGIHYNLSLPLHNHTDSPKQVAIKIETPVQNETQEDTLTFLNPPDNRIFFRGTVLVRYMDSWNIPQARYFHLVQRRGQQGEPLVRFNMPPGDRRVVKVEFLYPPDATPPQVLTVQTLDSEV